MFGEFGDRRSEIAEVGDFEEFGDWRVRRLESFGEFREFGDRRLRRSEISKNSEIGEFGDWRVSESLESSEIGNVGNWKIGNVRDRRAEMCEMGDRRCGKPEIGDVGDR